MTGDSKPQGINWLPQEEYDKTISQLRLQLNGVFNVFNLYGQGVYIPLAIEECVRLAEDFGLKVRGVNNKPIALELVRRIGRKNGKG